MSSQAASVETGRIETNIPARLDRLPWAKFHWLVVIGLGTVWILDGLEVTIVGSIASRLTEKGSGIAISTAQIGTAAAVYVAGACLGALFFGQLTDRFGRKKLFIICVAGFTAASFLCALAQNIEQMVAFRLLQGMAGAALVPLSQAVLLDINPIEKIGQAMAI